MERKCAFVIGATKGIGLAIVEKFAGSGYDIVATYNSGSLSRAEQICDKNKVKLLSVKMDVSKFEDVEKGFQMAFEVMGKIDAIVYNAGISLGEKLLCDQSVEDIDSIIDVNLKGAIYCNRQAQKHLLNQKNASIVNVSSIYGIYGGSCESAYSASKGGIVALTKAMSDECACFGVRVNAVAPGCIDTAMTAGFTQQEKDALIEKTPLGRIGKPEDVANAVYFLASEDASFITGEVLTVSGGVTKF